MSDAVKCDSSEILYGRDYFYEELLGLKFRISTFSFFQTNTCGAEVLYETAREYVGSLGKEAGKPDSIVYDLYSGTGTIAQLMAPVAKKSLVWRLWRRQLLLRGKMRSKTDWRTVSLSREMF